MKTLLNLVALVACLLAFAALPCRAGYVYWETFNYYSNGYGLVAQSDGKWQPWQGSSTSDDAMISNDPPRYAGNLRLSQAEAIGTAGFQEVVSFFPDALGAAPRARLRMSINFLGGAKNSDFYLWMCSGDAAALDTAYADSGPGGLIVNWSGLGSGSTVPLHFWNTFGIWKIADISSGEWHEIQYDIVKNQVGITGGLVGFTIDGTYLGAVPFPLQLQDSVISNVINAFDFYATDNDLLLVDNIVIEDIPVDIIATNFYVSVTGNDANDGTTPANAWATLGHALTMLEGIGIQLNPTAFVTPTQAQPLPTQYWAVINVGTGMFVGEKNIPADTLDIYRYGYSNLATYARNEQLHNFLLVKGAGIGKTIFVDQLCSNDAKFKVYSRWARFEDFTLWAQGLGGGETFFLDPIHFRPLDGLAMDFRVERVQVCPAPGAPPELLGNRAGVSFLANWRDCRNKVVRGCLFNAVGIGVKNYNNVTKFPVLVENCTFADLNGAPFGGRGIGVLCEGAGGWVKNCLFVNVTTNAPDLTRGIGVHTWPILAANQKSAFSQVYLIDNNMFNIGQNSTNFTKMDAGASYIAAVDVICNGPVVFQTLDDMPYRAGLGNIGYMAARGGTYYVDRNSPIARNTGAMGTSWSSAFRSPGYAVNLLGQSPPLSDATYPVTYYLRGKFTNEFTASNSNPKVGRGIQLPGTSDYVSFIGEGPDKTLIYKNSDFRNETGADGRNLTIYPIAKQSCTIRNMALVVESWFPPGANAYSLGAFRNWNSQSFLSNVYVSVLYRDTNTMQLAGLDTRQTAAISVSGTPRLEAIDCCFEGGYNGFRANDGPLTQKFTSCTFKGVYSPDGDALGGYGVLLVGGNRNVELNKCIIGDSTRGAVYLGNTSTIFGDDNIIYGNGTTGVVNEGTGIDALTNNKMFNPLLAAYDNHPLASPYRASGYGWFGRPPSAQAAGGWPRSRADRHNSSLSQAECSTLYTQSWSAPLVLYTPNNLKSRSGHLALDTSKIVVMTPDATLCAYCRSTGTQLWNYSIGLSAGQWTVGGDPLILEDGSVLAAGSNHMWRFNADGSLLWKTEVRADGWVATPVAVSPDCSTAYAMGVFGSTTNALVAFDVATGAVQWRFHVPGARFGAMAVDSAGTIYFGSTVDWGGAGGGPVGDRIIYAVTATGTLKWACAITNEMMQGLVLSTDESKLFCKTFDDDGYICALDAATGAVLWKVSLGPGSEPFPDIARDAQNNLYGAGAGGFAKWNASGALQWANTNYTSPYCPAISSNGLVWFRAQNVTNALIGVNALDGTQVALLPINGESSENAWAVPAIDDEGNVYVATRYTLFRYAIVPEPALAALVALLLLALRRR